MRKIALLIGVSEYQSGLNQLLGAVKDVEAMQRVLQHPEMGGFAEVDITVLKNPDNDWITSDSSVIFNTKAPKGHLPWSSWRLGLCVRIKM